MDSMASNSKHTEWILETIDHLRRRKARPDLERICHVVRRRYGLCAAETEAKLEKLVDAEVVIKVDYKGSTSYRNAAKWRKSMLGCAVLNSTTISIKIIEAILEISRAQLKEDATKQMQEGGRQEEREDIEQSVRKFVTEIGVPLENINMWLKVNCDGFDNIRSPLTVVLKREIDAGRVKRLLSCNYVITPAQMDEIYGNTIKPLRAKKRAESKSVGSPSISQNGSASVSTSEESNSLGSEQRSVSQIDQRALSTPTVPPSSAAPQPARRGRPPKHRPSSSLSQAGGSTTSTTTTAASSSGASTSKLKRILTNESHTGDASEQKMPKKMETRKASAGGEPACNFCKLTSQSNPQGVPEMLLLCKDCRSKAHPSCMNYAPLLASRAYRGPWQCMDCKTCCMCQDAGNPDQMLFCDGCDKGYHMNCHNPPINKQPSGTWECSVCRLENLSLQRSEFMSRQGNHHTVSHESAPPTPAESPIPVNLISNGDLQFSTRSFYLGDRKYPDASGWSVDDVVDYLTTAGFVEEARVFHEQEIDGIALLLLKRTDVLKGLDLKLGPALKLNRHIQGLQMACHHEPT